MHPTILAKRKAEAVGRLTYAAERLAETLGLDPALAAGLRPVGFKDAQVRELMFLEGAADLIQAVAIHSGAIQEPEAHWVEPAEAVPAEIEAAAAEEQPASKKPSSKKSTARKSKK